MSANRFTIDVPLDHPAFEGHFPGHPVLPGAVLLAEVIEGIERHHGASLQSLLVKVAKFHAPVGPGSCLTVDLVQSSGIAFTVSCGATRVATGTVAFQ